MAIFHFSAKVVSRKSGQSVIAKAAYNAREELTEERTGEVKNYTRAQGLVFSGIYTPAQAPKWAHDRAQLWNAAAAAEKRKDATLAREYQIALPHELTDEQRRYLVQDFVKESFTRRGYAADVCIHAPDRDGDQRNFHAHILVSDRRLEANGFAPDKKERKLKSPERKAELEALREKWEHLANHHLERHGHDARIDRRSLKDQGSDREPTQHLGPYATQLERDGKESERGDLNRDIEARNDAREDLKEELQKTQEAQRAWLLAKQEQQKEELEKQQAERREQREKQAREFEEKVKQDIDGAVSSKHDSEQFRLEQELKENHVGLFGRTTARIKQFIGHKLDEHRAAQQKERLHKTLVENEQQASERDQRRSARQDKAHERGRATVEIKQAAAREKMGIHAPERDEALKEAEKVARRTEAEKGFRGVAEETTRETVSGLPTERAEERLAAWKHQPARAKERHESTLDKTIGAARKGKKAIGVAAREANKSIRVLDTATGISSGLNKGVVAILDGMTKPVEGIVEGIANLFSPPSAPPPRPAPSARERLQRQAARKRATEQALSNINQSLKDGNTINAADLQNLPKSQLERIRDGGDEYLQRLCLNWEMRQREERGRERER